MDQRTVYERMLGYDTDGQGIFWQRRGRHVECIFCHTPLQPPYQDHRGSATCQLLFDPPPVKDLRNKVVVQCLCGMYIFAQDIHTHYNQIQHEYHLNMRKAATQNRLVLCYCGLTFNRYKQWEHQQSSYHRQNLLYAGNRIAERSVVQYSHNPYLRMIIGNTVGAFDRGQYTKQERILEVANAAHAGIQASAMDAHYNFIRSVLEVAIWDDLPRISAQILHLKQPQQKQNYQQLVQLMTRHLHYQPRRQFKIPDWCQIPEEWFEHIYSYVRGVIGPEGCVSRTFYSSRLIYKSDELNVHRPELRLATQLPQLLPISPSGSRSQSQRAENQRSQSHSLQEERSRQQVGQREYLQQGQQVGDQLHQDQRQQHQIAVPNEQGEREEGHQIIYVGTTSANQLDQAQPPARFHEVLQNFQIEQSKPDQRIRQQIHNLAMEQILSLQPLQAVVHEPAAHKQQVVPQQAQPQQQVVLPQQAHPQQQQVVLLHDQPQQQVVLPQQAHPQQQQVVLLQDQPQQQQVVPQQAQDEIAGRVVVLDVQSDDPQEAQSVQIPQPSKIQNVAAEQDSVSLPNAIQNPKPNSWGGVVRQQQSSPSPQPQPQQQSQPRNQQSKPSNRLQGIAEQKKKRGKKSGKSPTRGIARMSPDTSIKPDGQKQSSEVAQVISTDQPRILLLPDSVKRYARCHYYDEPRQSGATRNTPALYERRSLISPPKPKKENQVNLQLDGYYFDRQKKYAQKEKVPNPLKKNAFPLPSQVTNERYYKSPRGTVLQEVKKSRERRLSPVAKLLTGLEIEQPAGQKTSDLHKDFTEVMLVIDQQTNDYIDLLTHQLRAGLGKLQAATSTEDGFNGAVYLLRVVKMLISAQANYQNIIGLSEFKKGQALQVAKAYLENLIKPYTAYSNTTVQYNLDSDDDSQDDHKGDSNNGPKPPPPPQKKGSGSNTNKPQKKTQRNPQTIPTSTVANNTSTEPNTRNTPSLRPQSNAFDTLNMIEKKQDLSTPALCPICNTTTRLINTNCKHRYCASCFLQERARSSDRCLQCGKPCKIDYSNDAPMYNGAMICQQCAYTQNIVQLHCQHRICLRCLKQKNHFYKLCPICSKPTNPNTTTTSTNRPSTTTTTGPTTNRTTGPTTTPTPTTTTPNPPTTRTPTPTPTPKPPNNSAITRSGTNARPASNTSAKTKGDLASIPLDQDTFYPTANDTAKSKEKPSDCSIDRFSKPKKKAVKAKEKVRHSGKNRYPHRYPCKMRKLVSHDNDEPVSMSRSIEIEQEQESYYVNELGIEFIGPPMYQEDQRESSQSVFSSDRQRKRKHQSSEDSSPAPKKGKKGLKKDNGEQKKVVSFTNSGLLRKTFKVNDELPSKFCRQTVQKYQTMMSNYNQRVIDYNVLIQNKKPTDRRQGLILAQYMYYKATIEKARDTLCKSLTLQRLGLKQKK